MVEEQHQRSGKYVPVEWVIPEDIGTTVATNIIVQHSAEEFLISFFEIVPPPFLGSDEEIAEQLAKISAVRAKCVARILVTPARMEQFIIAFQENFDRWKSKLEGENNHGS